MQNMNQSPNQNSLLLEEKLHPDRLNQFLSLLQLFLLMYLTFDREVLNFRTSTCVLLYCLNEFDACVPEVVIF